jgi:hypothetical protein
VPPSLTTSIASTSAADCVTVVEPKSTYSPFSDELEQLLVVKRKAPA